MKFFSVLSVLFFIMASVAAKEPVTKGETDPVMLDLDPYMIDALRGNKLKGRFGKEGGIVQLMKEPKFQALVKKHDLQLFNGPMLGAIASNSAKVWIRSAGAATFQVKINDILSKPVTTSEATDFTGTALIEGLKPFTDYKYSIILNGKEISKDHFRLRTAPAKGQQAKFSIAFGSGARYQPKKEGIWRVMAKQRPMAYLGLGDNLYIDVPKYQNVQRLHYYRRMLRQEYREIIASSGIYAIWDDHDMYDNDSEGGYGLNTTPYKMPNFKVFEQNWNNPFNGQQPENPGTYFNFRIGDVEVFMTDGRFYRYGPSSSKKDKEKKAHTMLGETQKKWLLNALKKSTAKFKVLASGTMWHAAADKGGYDSWAGPKSPFQKERDEIFDLINKEKIDGVVLVSGDRHRTDIWKTDRKKGYPLFEFLSAKMTNEHSHKPRKEALWSYSNKMECFWGQLDFDTTQKDPVVTFKAVNQDGKVLKEFPLKLSEISHK
ncbi:MAG: alkaline phosphatase family protein [Lentisphaeraceae bacterium]|nr:alkaline phosphatase family protein [Lentisphaeraceae bacterium]